MSDYRRFSAQQILAHCRTNLRASNLNPTLFHTFGRDAQHRAERSRQRVDQEMRAFRTWRTQFMVPRREVWGKTDEPSNTAVQDALRWLWRLQVTWTALAPFLPDEEREELLGRRVE